ncbi:MAG TPA: GNAT family N-acetyltransferase [Beijerinckiaceae bacterium]|nr:GNAT family N-acetyltransferase [Beijerinckiaceae bacterium]
MLTTVLNKSAGSDLTRMSGSQHAGFTVAVRRDVGHAVAVAARLLQGGSATVFQSAVWVEAFARTVAAERGCAFFMVEVRATESGRPVMLLPFLLRERRGFRLLEVPDFGLADYVAPMFARGFDPDRQTMHRIWAQVRAVLPKADVVRFVKMPGEVGGRVNPLVRLSGTRCSSLTAWGVDLGPVETIWRDAIACDKRRADLDARWRKLNKRGVVEFRTASTEADADAFFETMVQQRSERFRALNFPNALDKPEIRDLYRSLLRPGEPASPAVVQALLVDGRIVATGYGLVGNGAFHMIFPTFQAETWRNYSPGLQLFRKSMEWSARKGLRYYDFTVGSEGFKRDFGAREQPLFERYEALSFAGLLPVGYVALHRFIRTQPWLASLLRAVKSMFMSGGR